MTRGWLIVVACVCAVPLFAQSAGRFRFLPAAGGAPPATDDVYFRMNCDVGWPQCGMDQNVNVAEMGTTWNMTQQVAAGPQGQTAARFSWPGPSPVGEEYFGWRENGAPAITQGASVFLRYKIRFVSPQTVGSAGVKLFILGDSVGDDGDRVIGTLKVGCAGACWNFDVDKNINGTRAAFTNLAADTWHSIQIEVDTSTTTVSTDGQFKLWVNSDVYASATDTEPGLTLPTPYSGELGFGFFGNTTDGGAHAVYDLCCFEYGPTFDNTWTTGGRFWGTP
jgi:hypothetical protein